MESVGFWSAVKRGSEEQAPLAMVRPCTGASGSAAPSPVHRAVDSGADLVLGSHPHVLQEVEEYGGGLIAYSLGNFVFDGFSGTSNDSAILEVSLTERGVTRWELHSVKIIDDGLPRLRQE